jgi:hypothetical protein
VTEGTPSPCDIRIVRTCAGILASMLGDLGDPSDKLCISFDAVCT